MPRVMEIATPLGADVLLFHTMQTHEEMSRPSECQLELLSEQGAIDIDAILGKNVTVTLALPDDKVRYFNGYVTRFAQQGMRGRYHLYTATVRPWLWFLTRTTDCRIFQAMSVPEILTKVFTDHGTADYLFELTSTYEKWVYCVQYRETDFNFVSRLMEQEGIYYYFRHADGKHTLVITDSVSKQVTTAGYESVPFILPDQLARPDVEHVSSWEISREVQPGSYLHFDHNFELPHKHLEARAALTRGYQPSTYEIFDYPGGYAYVPGPTPQDLQKIFQINKQWAAVRIDEYGTQYEIAHGASNARGLAGGSLMTLKRHPRDDQNREYQLLSVAHQLEFHDYEALPRGGKTQYACTFAAMPTAQQFRPRRLTPKPFVQGPQTGVVVGPAGEEIFTDKYGRVKVQFHWDRQGKRDHDSSCWIRVSHPWAGKAWGAIHIPRIGQEVIVDFLDGDPDRPIITGRVYNAEMMPPYALPANKTQSGIQTRSVPKGTPVNFNEIRFEDNKGAEQLYIHAEKNQDIVVENDETHSVGHNRTKEIGNDEKTLVKHDRTETVDNNEKITIHGARKETVDKDETITIHGSRTETVDKNESITVFLQRTCSVGINETISVGGAQQVTVGALQAITVGANQSTAVGSNQSNSVGGSQTTDISKNASMTVGGDESRKVTGARTTNIGKNDTLKVGKNLLLEAADSVTIKTGDASITMKKDGTIAIKGKDITIEGSGKIAAKAASDVVIKGSKVTLN